MFDGCVEAAQGDAGARMRRSSLRARPARSEDLRQHAAFHRADPDTAGRPDLLESNHPWLHHYSQHAVALKAELGEALPREELRQLYRKNAWRHGIVAVRQFAILGLATWGLIHFEHSLIWIPLALVQGFTIFNFTILLHEVVHHTVFEGRHRRAERALGLLYAIPSGISPSQFTRWHLDHHAELGSDEGDPKRHHLAEGQQTLALLYAPGAVPVCFRPPGGITYDLALQHVLRGSAGLDCRTSGDRRGLRCSWASTRRWTEHDRCSSCSRSRSR